MSTHDGAPERARIPLLLTGALVLGSACTCDGLALLGEPARVEPARADYAVDRASFATSLTRRGPAPQNYQAETPPPDVRVVPFVSGDLQLSAWVASPARDGARRPAVLFLHGGFSFATDDFDMARPYLAAGFVVVVPMLRGENGQPGDFTMFFAEVDDVLAAAALARALPEVDPSRLFLTGHSAGGTLALLAGMRAPAFRAVTSMSASPDQAIFLAAPRWARDAPFDVTVQREVQIRSPLAYATSLKSPTRVYCGGKELGYTRTTHLLAERAKAAGLDVAAQIFSGDHYSAVPAEIEASIAFFRASMGGR